MAYSDQTGKEGQKNSQPEKQHFIGPASAELREKTRRTTEIEQSTK